MLVFSALASQCRRGHQLARSAVGDHGLRSCPSQGGHSGPNSRAGRCCPRGACGDRRRGHSGSQPAWWSAAVAAQLASPSERPGHWAASGRCATPRSWRPPCGDALMSRSELDSETRGEGRHCRSDADDAVDPVAAQAGKPAPQQQGRTQARPGRKEAEFRDRRAGRLRRLRCAAVAGRVVRARSGAGPAASAAAALMSWSLSSLKSGGTATGSAIRQWFLVPWLQ